MYFILCDVLILQIMFYLFTYNTCKRKNAQPKFLD